MIDQFFYLLNSVKYLSIILIIIFPADFSYAQKHDLAMASGAISLNTELNKYFMSNPDLIYGFNYRFTPETAVFFLGADLICHANNKSLYIPLTFNFRMGDKILFSLGGGGMPVIYLKSDDIRPIEFGGLIQTAVQTDVGEKWLLRMNVGLIFVPSTRLYPLKNGELGCYRSLDKNTSISLGVGYSICQKNAEKKRK